MISVWQVAKTVVGEVAHRRNRFLKPVSRARGSVLLAADFRALASAVCVLFLATAIWPSRASARGVNQNQYCLPVQIQLSESSGWTTVTNTTQSVYTGEQIKLNAAYSQPSDITVNSTTWSVPGTTAGGFTDGNSGGYPPATLNVQQPIFYWTVPANSETVTLTLNWTVNGVGVTGTSQAQATFDVLGPTSLSVTTAVTNWVVWTGPSLSFGCQLTGCNPGPGIAFVASAINPSGDAAGTFVWAQLLNTYTWTVWSGSSKLTCTWSTVPGLDSGFPINTGPTSSDSPFVPIQSNYTEETLNVAARRFLMWNPNVGNNPIPVPLGYVDWQAYGDETYDSSSGNATINSDSSGNANQFQADPNERLSWGTVFTGSIGNRSCN